jgi:hypothetical protein
LLPILLQKSDSGRSSFRRLSNQKSLLRTQFKITFFRSELKSRHGINASPPLDASGFGSELIIFLNECAKIRKSNHQAKAYQQTDQTERYDCEERMFFLR